MKSFLKYYVLDRLTLIKKVIQLNVWKQNSPILIHTMAKVGSLSVYKSLNETLPKTPTFHTHNLDINEVQNHIDLCFENGLYPGSRSPVFIIHNQIISKNRSYKLITLFRDPIERNISAFFDAFELYVGVKPQDYKGDLETLEKLFHMDLPYKYPLQWFDEILFNDTKINVYDYPFNKELGYGLIKHENSELLLINCYIEDSLKEKLIKEFCKAPNFKLTNTNITANKKSGDLYKAFKKHIKFSKIYLKECYDSKYSKHFFTIKERNLAIKKWQKI